MLYEMKNQLFWDGNKRTSTICANKIMIKNDNEIIRIPDSNLEEFNILLSRYYSMDDKESIEQFIYNNCIDGIIFEE